jgi:glycosyltransferase involved in cell wall biosynthesis
MFNYHTPLVSVIIPCYNYGHFLSETLDSLLSQTYSCWECIIVNDGSTDNTEEVALTFMKTDKRFRYIYQKNAGLSAARNMGIRNSQGDYIQFLDADDMIVCQKLEKQLKIFRENPNAGISYGISEFFFNDNIAELHLSKDNKNHNWMPKVSGGRSIVLPKLVDWNIMVVSSPLIKRSVITDIGFFDETLPSLEDWDYWLRAALLDVNMLFTDDKEIATLIRVSHTSMMTNTLVMNIAELQVRKKMMAALQKYPSIYQNNKRRLTLLQNSLYYQSKQQWDNGQKRNALRIIRTCRLKQIVSFTKYMLINFM